MNKWLEISLCLDLSKAYQQKARAKTDKERENAVVLIEHFKKEIDEYVKRERENQK